MVDICELLWCDSLYRALYFFSTIISKLVYFLLVRFTFTEKQWSGISNEIYNLQFKNSEDAADARDVLKKKPCSQYAYNAQTLMEFTFQERGRNFGWGF